MNPELNPDEVHYDPPPEDAIEDKIREAVMPTTLTDVQIQRIVACFRDEEHKTPPFAKAVRNLAAILATCERSVAKRWGLYFALDLQMTRHLTMERVADHYGITDSAISEEANKWIDMLDLPRPRAFKSQEARKSYRAARKANLLKQRQSV